MLSNWTKQNNANFSINNCLHSSNSYAMQEQQKCGSSLFVCIECFPYTGSWALCCAVKYVCIFCPSHTCVFICLYLFCYCLLQRGPDQQFDRREVSHSALGGKFYFSVHFFLCNSKKPLIVKDSYVHDLMLFHTVLRVRARHTTVSPINYAHICWVYFLIFIPWP